MYLAMSKRAQYDQFGHAAFENGGAGGAGGFGALKVSAVLAAEAWKIFLICSSAGRAAARVVLMPVLSAVLIYALTWKSL